MDQQPTSSCKKIKTSHEGDTTTTPHPIKMLSKSCLAAIISRMSWEDRLTCETVSKKWFEASQLAWKKVKVLRTNSPHFSGSLNKTRTYEETFAKILERCGPYLTKLYVDSNVNVSVMPLIRDKCTNLVHLSLDFMKHNEDCFIDAFSNMTKLKSISIKGYSNFPEEYGCLTETEMLKSIHQGIEKISIISDESNCIISEKFASTLTKFNALKSLVLHCCMLDNCVLDVIRNMATLKCLDLSDCWLPPKSNLFEPSRLDNLEQLNVQGLEAGEGFVISIVAKCKKLVYLNVSSVYTTVESFTEIGKLTMLRHLDISRNNGLHDAIIDKFKNLQTLHCWDCPHITDASIVRILRNSPRLKNLVLWNTGISTETIRCAVAVTLARTNGITLDLQVPMKIRDTFLRANNHTIPSPLLQLRA